MRTLKLTLEYDGTDFVGWQRQADGISIQGLLEDALAAFERNPVTVHGAGRTDAGVHALGQVASVSLAAQHPAGTLQRALNAVLPPAVRVVEISEAAADFHARFAAVAKTYEYRIVNATYISPFLYRYAWHVPMKLDIEAMRDAGALLMGTHDFAAFQGAGSDVKTTTRTIQHIAWSDAEGPGRPLVIRFEGDGFLRHMVRNIVGTLVDIGAGRWEAAQISGILESRDRTRAGQTAPAAGLFLVAVRYPPAASARPAPPSPGGFGEAGPGLA
jgi:tRNA pseudouridine38-40 synthase